MNHNDTFQTICTFLEPLELNRCRYLSKTHHKWTSQYLSKICLVHTFQDMICPLCAKWIDLRDISELTHFWDIYENPRLEKRRINMVKTILGDDIRRSFLFCEDCESEEMYDLNTDEFRFKGSRSYCIYKIRNIHNNQPDYWSLIYTTDHQILWNEYRCANLEFIDIDN